jgi:hypothetical protein
MTETLSPVANSDNSASLYGNHSAPKHSDTTFEENLKTEEEKLKIKSLLFSPWGNIQTLMQALYSNYDDSLTLSKIENEFTRHKEKEPAPVHPTVNQKAEEKPETHEAPPPPP